MTESRYSRNFAYVVGSDVDKFLMAINTPGIEVSGHTNTYRLRTQEPDNFGRIHVTKNFFRQKMRYDLSVQHCVVNLVTDPDQNPKVLRNVERMLKNYRGQVINHPTTVLQTTRDQMAARLRDIPGLIAPPVVRLKTGKAEIVARKLQAAQMSFPAIVRQAGTHSGTVLGVFDRSEDIAGALTTGCEHFVIGFIDFRSSDGIYRKYRVFFIGEHIILRHMLHSEHWNVHAATRADFMAGRPDLLAEERQLFENGLPKKVLRTLEAVRERVALDFFGIDFAIGENDEVILFEANATMNFFPFSDDPVFDYVNACLPPAQAAFNALLYGDDAEPDPTLQN